MKDLKEHKELLLFYLTEILDLFILYLFLKLLCLEIITIVFNKFYDEEKGSDEYYDNK